MIRLATVSPCYNEELVLESSVSRLTALFEELIKKNKISADSMIVYDWEPDDPLQYIESWLFTKVQ